MVVSDHGFGPCLGRIHVNRILVQAGVAKNARLGGAHQPPHLPGRRPPCGSGARSATTPAPRSASFDQSLTAQYPFDWKKTLAFAPHQDTAAMVYVNCAAATAESKPLPPA